MLAAVALLAATSFSACKDDGTPCYPQDYRACDCPGAPHGFQECSADGQSYGACDCSGKIPGVAGMGDAGTSEAASTDASDAGALLPFMSTCDTNEQCDTGLCWNFPSKGAHCTKHCTTAADCPPPSGGCNPQSLCKAP